MKNEEFISSGNMFISGNSDAENILEGALKNKKVYVGNSIDVIDLLKQRKYRRYDKFSLVSVMGIEEIVSGLELNEENRDIATVFSTSFGPINTNLDFAWSIHDETKVPSPIEFSHTVNNAALGHLCKEYKLKGPSTLLLSSDSVGVAVRMLRQNLAQRALIQGAEEYCQDLYNVFEDKGIHANECVARIVLSKNDEVNEIKAKLVAGNQGSLGGHPFFESLSLDYEEILVTMKKTLEQEEVEDIDYVLINTFDKNILKHQEKYLEEMKINAKVVNLYESVGCLLGADLCSQLVVASSLIRKGKLKIGHSCLINSFDISGNYIVYLIKAVN